MEISRESLKFPLSLAVTTVSPQIVANSSGNSSGINSFDAILSPFL
jgi:hypothetical protein